MRHDGGGEGWYVATGPDDAGVRWVVRSILSRHGLVGPYADATGVDLLTGRRITQGETLHLEPTDVVVLRED